MTTHRTGRPRTSKTAPPAAGYRTPMYRVEPEASPSGPLARMCGYALIVLAPLVLLSVLAAIICYVRLLHGPVSLQAFNERIERGISAELGGFKADIDDAILTLGDNWRVELRLTNLRITEPDGDLVASAPLAAVDLDPGSLLWMDASPQRVFFIEPKLSLFYSAESGLAMSFSQMSPASDVPPTNAAPLSPPSDVPSASHTTAIAKTSDPSLPPSFHRVDLGRAIAEMSSFARRGGLATSHLKEIGVRNATVVLDYGGTRSELSVAEGAIGLEAGFISGAASINSARGLWMVSFRTDEPEPNALKVSATVRDLIPSTLAQALPHMSLLEMLDMPVAGDLTLDLSASGDFKSADLIIDAGHGKINLPSLGSAPIEIDNARFKLGYDAGTHRIELTSSTITWGNSHVTLEGGMTRETQEGGAEAWHFGLNGLDGVLAAEEFGIAGLKLEGLTATGRAVPDDGFIELTRFSLKAGGSEFSANGEITSAGGTPSTRIDATTSPMALATLKALWPRAVASAARTWVGNHFTRGTVRSASLKILSGKFLEQSGAAASANTGGHISLAAEIGDAQMVPLPGGLPIEAPRATIRLEDSTLEVTVPDAVLVPSPTRQVPLKGVRFTVISQPFNDPIGELAFRSQTTLAALADVLNQSKLNLLGSEPLPIEDGVDGKVDGQVKITMPLVEGGSATARTEAKARITEIRGKPPGGRIELSGGSIDLDVSPIGVNASGQLIVNGVTAKIAVQRIFDAPPNMQPPLRLTAVLDNADRTQLKLDVNHLIQGEMPIEITVGPGPTGEQLVHARADLTNAELIFKELAWRKPAGRAASLEFDVSASAPEKVELTNFKLVGDNVAIEGGMTLDAENEVREFTFPSFSLNVVSRLDVTGKLSNDRVWTIAAKGSTFDAKDQLRTLLALGRTSDVDVKPLHPAKGVDLTASIDTVLGHSDVSMRNYKLKYSERQDQLIALEVQGTLDGGKPLSVVLKMEKDSRKIVAESGDAGQAFKFSGFYPNLQGGKARLEVNLEGRGAAEKSGILWVDNFRVLGDPIISEVYSSADVSGPAIDSTPSGQRRVNREVFDFERMKVPFSVGHGQFVLEDSYVRGQVLGASIRGKVDYTTQRINLGGTYVPLQGINSALCNIPLFGPIVSGLDCQGVFGITYAIQGPMSRPQVIVNPLSMLTPGIFRGIMEMTNPNPEVLPRAERPKAPAEQRVRASSSDVSGAAPQQKGKAKAGAATVDGWSSQTDSAPKPAKTKDAKKKQPAAEAKSPVQQAQ
jgi:hypothetical protein